ncbi:MAG TPA: MOSC domain-containing protein [Jatrophihabitans sp.]
MPLLDSVNLGRPRANPDKEVESTGIDKRPTDGPVEVRDPGPKPSALGSGVVGDFIGDRENHGGTDQALYSFAREDLDDWERRLGRELTNGFFGENLTTRGLDVAGARLGEQWRIGADVIVQVTEPRIPCSTFRGWIGEAGWLKTFTEVARPGAYLRILVPGTIRTGDPIEIVRRPEHDVTISLTYRALMNERQLVPLIRAAGDDLAPELQEFLAGQK